AGLGARVGLVHEVDPDRDGHAAAGDLVADRLGVVAPDPYADHQIGREAVEPNVLVVGARAGLAGGRATDRGRILCGTATDDALHHVDHHVRDLGRDHLRPRRRVAQIFDDLVAR